MEVHKILRKSENIDVSFNERKGHFRSFEPVAEDEQEFGSSHFPAANEVYSERVLVEEMARGAPRDQLCSARAVSLWQEGSMKLLERARQSGLGTHHSGARLFYFFGGGSDSKSGLASSVLVSTILVLYFFLNALNILHSQIMCCK